MLADITNINIVENCPVTATPESLQVVGQKRKHMEDYHAVIRGKSGCEKMSSKGSNSNQCNQECLLHTILCFTVHIIWIVKLKSQSMQYEQVLAYL